MVITGAQRQRCEGIRLQRRILDHFAVRGERLLALSPGIECQHLDPADFVGAAPAVLHCRVKPQVCLGIPAHAIVHARLHHGGKGPRALERLLGGNGAECQQLFFSVRGLTARQILQPGGYVRRFGSLDGTKRGTRVDWFGYRRRTGRIRELQQQAKALFSALDQLDGNQSGAGHPGGHIDHVRRQVDVLQPGVPVFGRCARRRLLIEYLQSSHHAACRETTPVVELRERLGNGPAWHCLVERDESACESKRDVGTFVLAIRYPALAATMEQSPEACAVARTAASGRPVCDLLHRSVQIPPLERRDRAHRGQVAAI